MPALIETLLYTPVELRFGTSGRRGRVVDLTQLEIYINVLAELEYLKSLAPSAGGICEGGELFVGYDLRPSSISFVIEAGGRGEIAQAVFRAADDAGMRPVNCGPIPTPALTAFAIGRERASVMVTGSHIPFDRNGYKMNSAHGELLKSDEGPIAEYVARVRSRLYSESAETSAFASDGLFRSGSEDLPPVINAARDAYIRRYTEFFPVGPLHGLRLLLYEHSAVGREILAEILRELGAEVATAGRSSTFVPIDTENMTEAQIDVIQDLAQQHTDPARPFDAAVSTDGDSDRPLLLGVDDGDVRFFGGDLLGMVVAMHLHADAVVVPISCNDAIDRGALATVLEPKTRIGSPYVIAGMYAAVAKGKRRVCGWEANGGFLTGSDIVEGERRLPALPTRDAVLPLICALKTAKDRGVTLQQIFDELPKRFGKSALLAPFTRLDGQALVEYFTPSEDRPLATVAEELREIFTPADGFAEIAHLDNTDGFRIRFSNGDVAHMRPSGNADELRIYATADTHVRADEIVAAAIRKPDGLLLRLAAAAHLRD